jgi:hypothetical protein
MTRKHSFIILATLLLVNTIQAQSLSDNYLQEIKSNIQLPEDAETNVIKLFKTQSTITALTINGVYQYSDENWIGKAGTALFKTAGLDKEDNVWLATAKFIQNENGSKKFHLPDWTKNDTILSLFWEDQTLHVGTTNGMLSRTNEKWQKVSATNGKRINSIALDNNGILWLASNKGLLKRTPVEWQNMDEMLMAADTKEMYFNVYVPKGTNDLLFSAPLSVGCIAENGEHWMWSGTDGLPYGPVTTIKSYNKTLWFGTHKGVAKKDDEWRYYHGKRWLPNNKINDILPIDEYTTWIATPSGISQIQEVKMNLEEKAAHIENVIDTRHNRRGIINVSHLEIPGDLSTSKTVNQDNDGLWTSTYLAAESFRYAVTKSDEAKLNAIRTYEAIEWLEEVTGIPGLPARSYAKITDTVQQSRSPHAKIWRPSPNKEWQWLDDCSSDEIVGHMFALSVFYDLVADNKQRKRIEALVTRIMDHIIDNDFHLIDYDGLPTRWGVYHPDSINHSKNWAYEKGLYSLELLAHLKTAVHITGNEKFEKTYRHLIEKHNYAENTVQAKFHGPFEKSYAEDILTLFPYYCLSRYATNDQYWPLYKKSIERTWSVIQNDGMPVWNIITSIALKKDCSLNVAKEELELFPMDLIDWRMINSHRWDLPENEIGGRFGDHQSTRRIPTSESQIWRWNTNPHLFDTGTDGKREVSGTYFLLPYWMARHHELFK